MRGTPDSVRLKRTLMTFLLVPCSLALPVGAVLDAGCSGFLRNKGEELEQAHALVGAMASPEARWRRLAS